MIVQLVTVVSRRVTKDMYSTAQTEQRRNLRLLLLFHFPHTSGGHPKDSGKLPITSPAFFFLSDCLGLGLCYFAYCLAFLTPLFFFRYTSVSFLWVNSLDCVLSLPNIHPFLPIFLISITRAPGAQQALEDFPWGNGVNAGKKVLNTVALVILTHNYQFESFHYSTSV